MDLIQAVVLGVVEGLTEFLPVSSTAHLTITEKLLGLPIDDRSITGFTAVIQVGAIVAVLIFFRRDIVTLVAAWVRGLFSAERRRDPDYRLAWLVILGSLPIGIVGFLARDVVSGPLRSLWVVAVALIAWSGVMALAERLARQTREQRDLTLTDSLLIGFAQALALVPGVSRSGATISVGLILDLNRVAATRLSFLLGIPALVAAGVYELPSALEGGGVGLPATAVGTVVSFVAAYASIAWLLRFVAHHTLIPFVVYRVALGLVLIALLAAGVLTAT